MGKSKTIAVLTAAILVLTAFCLYLAVRVSRLERQSDADRRVVFDECELDAACPVSMYELLVHPYRYDGMRIRVTGIYQSGFEMSALFVAMPGEGGELDYKNAIWLGGKFADLVPGGPAALVVGTFHAGASGHLGQYPGELIVD